MAEDMKKPSGDFSDDQTAKMYPVLETTIPINPTVTPQSPNGVPQAGVRYINHSRNASSVSKNAVTFAMPPPNKPDAIDSVLKMIGLRMNYERSQAQKKKICFVRIASTDTKSISTVVFHTIISRDFFWSPMRRRIDKAKRLENTLLWLPSK